MINDITTVIWKEIREALQSTSPRGRGKFGLLIIFVVMGVFLPLQLGTDLIRSNIGLLIWGWVPMIMISAVVADAFAGERERRTLETLLSTRLPDTAILMGKILAGVLYGYALTWSLILIALITLNISQAGNGLILLSPTQFGTIAIISFLTSLLTTSAGVLVSLRAGSVRQAQQTLSMLIFLLFVPMFALGALPEEAQLRLYQFLSTTSTTSIIFGGALFLVITDGFLLFLANRRFKRNELILD
jgi:ABC-2 type transport system permease protein